MTHDLTFFSHPRGGRVNWRHTARLTWGPCAFWWLVPLGFLDVRWSLCSTPLGTRSSVPLPRGSPSPIAETQAGSTLDNCSCSSFCCSNRPQESWPRTSIRLAIYICLMREIGRLLARRCPASKESWCIWMSRRQTRFHA
jgi:hypothetical protein